jgi:hypothetical protein
MYVAGFDSPDDLLEFVRILANDLGELGFEESEGELLAWANCAYTTSSEFLGQLGNVCRAVLDRDGPRLPPCLKQDIARCLEAYAAGSS